MPTCRRDAAAQGVLGTLGATSTRQAAILLGDAATECEEDLAALAKQFSDQVDATGAGLRAFFVPRSPAPSRPALIAPVPAPTLPGQRVVVTHVLLCVWCAPLDADFRYNAKTEGEGARAGRARRATGPPVHPLHAAPVPPVQAPTVRQSSSAWTRLGAAPTT